MNHIAKALLFIAAIFTFAEGLAQQKTWQEMHKVKRHETIFGISREYGITVEELIKANPDMSQPGYELKKGDYIYIPYAKAKKGDKKAKATSSAVKPAVTKAVKVGVMLPLHNVDGDGRRMVEYYRGMLMAVDKMRMDGISVDIKAVNVPIDADVSKVLAQQDMSGCNLIFGPLYSAQVKPLSEFARKHNIKLVIPFSITGNDVATCPNIYQVYQSPEYFNEQTIGNFLSRFTGYNVVVIDCNDRTSQKGMFTFSLRRRLEAKGRPCAVTNLTSSMDMFSKQFRTDMPNVVVLNTGRSPELTEVLDKLDALRQAKPQAQVSLFGYTEWQMYAKLNEQRFCRYDTYIPTHAYFNAYLSTSKTFAADYSKTFGDQMLRYTPRFAITGYDHAMFFIRGINSLGKSFDGTLPTGIEPLQTPLRFVRVGTGGGYQNKGFMLIHFNRNRSISTINY